MVSLISFFIIRLSPVDPLAELKLNPSISKETLQRETKRLGLDKPIYVQYFLWAKAFVKGDLGVCSTGESVAAKLKERIPNTLLLTTLVIFLTWIVGVPLGILAAIKWKTPLDRVLTVLTSIGMAIPSFFFAILLLIFAVKTGWFPVGGLTSYNFDDMNLLGKIWDITHHLILPTTVLFTISLAGLQRQMRANLLDVLESDYVKFARAKGLSEFRVLFVHILRNSMIPILTGVVAVLPLLFMGSLLTESFFSIPGLGSYTMDAIRQQDFAIVYSMVYLGSVLYMFGLMLTDISYVIVDPRVNLQ